MAPDYTAASDVCDAAVRCPHEADSKLRLQRVDFGRYLAGPFQRIADVRSSAPHARRMPAFCRHAPV